MSRTIPLFGAHVCDGACWEVDCPARTLTLTRKQRRWIRRAAAKAARRAKRKARS